MNGVITQLWKRKETWHIVTMTNPESVLNEISQTEKGKSSGYTRTRPESSHPETQGRRVATTAREDGVGAGVW